MSKVSDEQVDAALDAQVGPGPATVAEYLSFNHLDAQEFGVLDGGKDFAGLDIIRVDQYRDCARIVMRDHAKDGPQGAFTASRDSTNRGNEMTKPTTTIDHQEPNLPSPHVDHSAVFMAELDNRLMTFDIAISALAAEMSGMRIAHDQEVAEKEQKFTDVMNDKMRLSRDMERGRKMALAGKAAYGDEIEPVSAVEPTSEGETA